LAGGALGASRGFAIHQRGFRTAKAGLRGFVQLGMNFHVASRHFGIGEEFDLPIAAGDFVFFDGLAATEPEHAWMGVEFSHTRAQGAASVFDDQIKNSGQGGVIRGIQIDREHTGQ
jgi:hypothetical protein